MAEFSDTTETLNGASTSKALETSTLPASVTLSNTPAGKVTDLREAALSLSLIDHELNAMQAAGFVVVRVDAEGSAVIIIRLPDSALTYKDGEAHINGVSATAMVKI